MSEPKSEQAAPLPPPFCRRRRRRRRPRKFLSCCLPPNLKYQQINHRESTLRVLQQQEKKNKKIIGAGISRWKKKAAAIGRKTTVSLISYMTVTLQTCWSLFLLKKKDLFTFVF